MSDHVPVPSNMFPDHCLECGERIDEHKLPETVVVERTYLLSLEDRMDKLETLARSAIDHNLTLGGKEILKVIKNGD